MAIIMIHTSTRRNFILVGTGYGVYRSESPSAVGGSLFPNIEQGEIPKVCVSDEEGMLHWFDPQELRVMSVDGMHVKNLLDQYPPIIDEPNLHGEESVSSDIEWETCPGCQTKVLPTEAICPSCELTLIDRNATF